MRPTAGRVLYLALDRPEQIKRSFQRMVSEEDREVLRDRLVVWRGPLPPEVKLTEPETLAAWARREGATHVIVDSYKDLASKLSDEAVASTINDTMQVCIAEGIGWVAVHHNRKANSANPHPKELADIYGSTFLTAGLGSVISIYGEPGDELVEAKHVKQPAESFGTFGIKHDHTKGHSVLTEPPKHGKVAERHEAIVKLLRIEPGRAYTAVEMAALLPPGSDGKQVGDKTIKTDMKTVAGTSLNVVQVAESPLAWCWKD